MYVWVEVQCPHCVHWTFVQLRTVGVHDVICSACEKKAATVSLEKEEATHA